MIDGVVNEFREAVVQLTLLARSGATQMIEAVVDTGFDGYFTLPDSVILSLGLT
jgi:predicted aspartyl protease